MLLSDSRVYWWLSHTNYSDWLCLSDTEWPGQAEVPKPLGGQWGTRSKSARWTVFPQSSRPWRPRQVVDKLVSKQTVIQNTHESMINFNRTSEFWRLDFNCWLVKWQWSQMIKSRPERGRLSGSSEAAPQWQSRQTGRLNKESVKDACTSYFSVTSTWTTGWVYQV